MGVTHAVLSTSAGLDDLILHTRQRKIKQAGAWLVAADERAAKKAYKDALPLFMHIFIHLSIHPSFNLSMYLYLSNYLS